MKKQAEALRQRAGTIEAMLADQERIVEEEREEAERREQEKAKRHRKLWFPPVDDYEVRPEFRAVDDDEAPDL
jgi:hypothetical protein